MKEVIGYIDNNKQRYIEELKDFLRVPSISTLEENKPDMQTAAQFVADKLKEAGLNKIQIFQTEGHPLVYGEWLGAPGKPTVLIYGHYDVQPVDPIELWTSQPFEPTIVGDNIFARGATDDKGQMYMHVKSVEAYFKTHGKLPVNVKFLIEGEEEIGSTNLSKFLKSNAELLNCLLYTSDAADERSSVDLGGRRIIKKKKNRETNSAIIMINQSHPQV